jgi:hypothetical protein
MERNVVPAGRTLREALVAARQRGENVALVGDLLVRWASRRSRPWSRMLWTRVEPLLEALAGRTTPSTRRDPLYSLCWSLDTPAEPAR